MAKFKVEIDASRFGLNMNSNDLRFIIDRLREKDAEVVLHNLEMYRGPIDEIINSLPNLIRNQ